MQDSALKQTRASQDEALQHQLDTGKITLEQFNALKLQLDAQYFIRLTQLEVQHEAEKLAREKQLREQEIKLQQQALDRANADQPNLLRNAAGSALNARDAAAKAESDAALLKDLQAKHPDIASEAIAAQGALMAAQKIADEHNAAAKLAGDPDDNWKVDPALTGKAGRLQKVWDTIKGLIAALPDEQTAAALAKIAADRAAGRAEKNDTRIDDAQESLKLARARQQIEDDAANKAFNLDRTKAGLTTRTELDKLGSTAPIDLAQHGEIKAALDQFHQHQKAYQDLVKDGMNQLTTGMVQKHEELRRELADLRQLIKGTYNP